MGSVVEAIHLGELLAEWCKFRDNRILPPAAGVQQVPAGACLGCGASFVIAGMPVSPEGKAVPPSASLSLSY